MEVTEPTLTPNKIELTDIKVPVLETLHWRETKDPCIVQAPDGWHLYGSGGTSVGQQWEIYHAQAESPEGPWHMQKPVFLDKIGGPEVCAPGVVYDPDDELFHMFVQRNCFEPYGGIEYLQSKDGSDFIHVNSAIPAIPGGTEAGVYDAHPAIIMENGKKQFYLTYFGFADPSVELHRNDVYLAKSENGWGGPWNRLGRIVSQEDIPHHNQPGCEGYEWGLEGSQLLQLPNGEILLNAVCFLPNETLGKRQRVFFAMSKAALGPYRSLGTTIPLATDSWRSGENGHASLILDKNKQDVIVAFQTKDDNELDPWRVALGKISVSQLTNDINDEYSVEDQLVVSTS